MENYQNNLIKKLTVFLGHKNVITKQDLIIKKYKIFGITLYKKIQYKALPVHLLEIKENEKCLCICPHPDDEIIGLGGLLLKYPHNFDILCLNSSGTAYLEKSAKERSDCRIAEFNNVMNKVGVNKSFIFEGYGEPPMFKQIDEHLPDYLNSVNLKNYDYIFIPYIKDTHPEHKYVGQKVLPYIAKKQGFKENAFIVMYEVWTPIECPNCVADIQDVIDEKINILKLYKSQIVDGWDYDRWALALNSYRSMQARGGGIYCTNYAEVFVKQTVRSFFITYKRRIK